MVLKAENISKSFEERTVLKDISLQLGAGEICALLGHSGSGKSTLIRILAGLISPDSGAVYLHDQKIPGPNLKLVPGHEEIRLVHQDFKLKHRMSVSENIRYELLHYVKDYQLERLEVLLELCKLAHLRNVPIELLSGGEKQRVAIARAIASEPEVILMDEPFSNLDLNTKSTLLQEIRSISRETETTIVLITHDTRDAMEVADKVMILYESSIIRQGTPREVYNAPKFPEVAGLFGSYNLLPDPLLPSLPDSESTKGLWPENLVIGKSGYEATVQAQTFMGSYWKVRLDVQGNTLFAYTPQAIRETGVSVSFREEDVFILKK